MGESGLTQPCLIALESALSGQAPVQKATVLTKNGDEHLFVLWESLERPYLGAIIPSGFKSGYGGEGARGFSLALCMIDEIRIPIDHMKLNEIAFGRIDNGDFLAAWHGEVSESAFPLVMPVGGWVFRNHWQLALDRRLWRVQSWKKRNTVMDWPSPGFEVDNFSWEVGHKLFIAGENLSRIARPENCQQVGLMLRDAWIEFTRYARWDIEEIDEGIGKDDVKRVLDAMQLPEHIAARAKRSHAWANGLQHDRGGAPQAAKRCFDDAVEVMAEIIEIRFPGRQDPRRDESIPTN